MRRGDWHDEEIKFLIGNYAILTIKELVNGIRALYPERDKPRTEDAINAKIKRLKAEGKLEGYKEEDTVFRSLTQRRR